MNKKMIMKNEIIPEEDWTNNDDWLKSYNLTRATLLEQRERGEEDLEEDASIGEMIAPFTHTEDREMGDIKQDEDESGDLSLCQ